MLKRIIFSVIFSLFSLFVFSQNLSKDQLEFSHILKASFTHKEVFNFLKSNKYIQGKYIYMSNNKTPFYGNQHTIKLMKNVYLKIMSDEDLFFHSIENILFVNKYELNHNQCELAVNNMSFILSKKNKWIIDSWKVIKK